MTTTTLSTMVDLFSFVVIGSLVLLTLIFVCCCCCKCIHFEIRAPDSDDEKASPDQPLAPPLSKEQMKRFGYRKRMGICSFVCFIIKAAWFLLGDICQALVFFMAALVSSFFAAVLTFPQHFGATQVVITVVAVLIALTVLGVILRWLWVFLAPMITDLVRQTMHTGHARLKLLEERMEAGVKQVQDVKAKLEEGAEHMKEGVQGIKDRLDKLTAPALENVQLVHETMKKHAQAAGEFGHRMQERANDLHHGAQHAVGCWGNS